MCENIDTLRKRYKNHVNNAIAYILISIILILLGLVNVSFCLLALIFIVLYTIQVVKAKKIKKTINKISIEKNSKSYNPLNEYSKSFESYPNSNSLSEEPDITSTKLVTGIINSSQDIYDEFIVIDTETTGLNPSNDCLIEIAAAKFKNGQVIDTYNTLINPQIHISSSVSKINNITDELVKYSPSLDSVLPEFLNFIDDLPLVAHNASFDIKFLNANLSLIGKTLINPVIDTLPISRKLFKQLPNHKLDTIRTHLNISKENSHRALPDCMATAQIYLKYCEKNVSIKENIKFKNLASVIDETSCYKLVKEILIKNDRDISYVRTCHTGVYFDIKAFYVFVRLKLNGKKQYILLHESKSILQDLFPSIVFEDATSKEIGKTRAILSKPEDLLPFEALILKSFDDSIESMESYRNNVGCGEENIQKYLS